MTIWPAMYRIDCEVRMLVSYDDEKLAIAIVPVLKVKAKPVIPYLPDMPDQPNTYSLPTHHLARKLK